MEYAGVYMHIMNYHAVFLHKKTSAMHHNIDEPKGHYSKIGKLNIQKIWYHFMQIKSKKCWAHIKTELVETGNEKLLEKVPSFSYI